MKMNVTTPPYQPLLDCLTIKQSKIHGLGLFATEDIPANTILGVSHVFHTETGEWTRTALGAFYNHSKTPNATKVSEMKRFQLKTLKKIKKGEEITVTYTMYDPTKFQ